MLWRRSEPDSYDLRLLNPERLNKERLGALLGRLDDTTHRKQYLRTDAREELRRWLEDPSRPLSSECYVLVSNWFLTRTGDRNSMVARYCGEVWDEMFACRPESRLSSPKSGKNHIIIPERFERFYKQLIDTQNTESTHNERRGSIEAMENGDKHQDDRRYSILAEITHLQPPFFAELNELVTKKKHLILEGSPGSGKTFVAEHFGRFLAYGEGGYASWVKNPVNLETSILQRFEVVQFHENYGYEDFMEGFRPRTENGNMVFERQSGIFKTFCAGARGKPGHYVMLIDEINRGKPSKIFGELLYLLEYRDKEVRLSSNELFSIPDNVLLIGTMNTADKSIALVDYALRRRFVFVPLCPVKNGDAPVLRSWLQEKRIENAIEILDLFVKLNQKIERDFGVDRQIGHSYFMDNSLRLGSLFPKAELERVWKYSILPLVQEYNYALSPEEVEKYGLAAIRKLGG